MLDTRNANTCRPESRRQSATGSPSAHIVVVVAVDIVDAIGFVVLLESRRWRLVASSLLLRVAIFVVVGGPPGLVRGDVVFSRSA